MTARSPSIGQAAPALPELGTSGGPSSLPANPVHSRVVSISPSAACVEIKPLQTNEPAVNRQPPAHATSPSLIDELRTMLAEAKPCIHGLRELLEHSARQKDSAREASTQLHERLRLGARMLQAFGAQMNRVETEMARAHDQRSRLEKTNEAASVHIEAATRNAAERIESTARHALAAMEERVKTLEARLRTIEEDHSACAVAADHGHQAPAVRAEDGTINSLAQAMRDLAARVDSMASKHSGRTETPPPLRLQKWADHG